MSAHAYIQWADVPQNLIDTSRQHVDGVTKAKVVAFDECPVCGEIEDGKPSKSIMVSFPFPRDVSLRHSLVDWLWYHGIHFTVVM
ncbi:phage portal protein [Paraburkholderia azotifigens]|uniref:phage portal protein n=1 Tax=Paraburkholderia azotifigens TaxID=2057004 RepID=UPI00318233CC